MVMDAYILSTLMSKALKLSILNVVGEPRLGISICKPKIFLAKKQTNRFC